MLFDQLRANRSQWKNYSKYFFTKELIKAKRNEGGSNNIMPFYYIEELMNEIPHMFKLWKTFNNSNKTLVRLYFNEINGTYIADDRFKNLCSVIQGFKKFKNGQGADVKEKSDKGNKGEMYWHLKRCFSPDFLAILGSEFHSVFIEKLLEVMASQRNFYQHLNSTVKYNLSDNIEELTCINQLLKANIRFRLLKEIQLSDDRINVLIVRDKCFFERELFKLQRVFDERFQLDLV